MFQNLNPGMVGVQASFPDSLTLAKKYGFAGADIDINRVMDLIVETNMAAVRDLVAESGVQPGAWGLPIQFRQDRAIFRNGLAALPHQAAAAAEIGCTRCGTFIMPGHNSLEFRENFDLHVERLRAVATVLADYGIRLGLEFVGPKTLRDTLRHNFLHTMDGMLALCGAIGMPNVGLLLDCYHLFTSHGTLDDVRKLRPADVVIVHINDGQAGLAADEQLDQVRELPGATGVIDAMAFLYALQQLGYDGPVTIEPFNRQLNEMDDDTALKETAAAMKKVWPR